MNKCKVVVLAMAVSILCAVQAKADSTPIVLSFEGVGDDVLIGNSGGASLKAPPCFLPISSSARASASPPW